MRKNILWTQRGGKRGSTLAVTFFLCTLSAMAAVLMVRTLLDHQRTNVRKRELTTAYFAAEGGLAQVLHWGNFPEEYESVDAYFNDNPLFERNMTTGDFPSLQVVMDWMTSTGYPEWRLNKDELGEFEATRGVDIAYIKRVALIPPDAVNDPVPCLFKVISEGRTASGSRRSILAYLTATPMQNTEVALAAGLISMASAAASGNGSVHWGESWAKGNFNMLSRSQCAHLDNTDGSYDSWTMYRTEGQISFGPTWTKGVGKDVNNETVATKPGAAPASGAYAAAFEQFIPPGTLEFPDMLSQYQTFKDQAKAHGRYYSTDATGKIYKDGVHDANHLVNFSTEFEFEYGTRATSPYDLLFIDTTDKTPPRYASDPGGTNLATVSVSGSSKGLKGVFWIGANFTQTGTGNPEGMPAAEKPDRTTAALSKVYLDGVFYSAGVVDMGGNPVVYGSVIAEKGYASGGTPEIYYNWKLRAGLELPKGNIGSTFVVKLQKNLY